LTEFLEPRGKAKRVVVQGITLRKLTLSPIVTSGHNDRDVARDEGKAFKMVKLAANGEEIFITVHGKQMAKLVGLPEPAKNLDKEKWLAKLARLRRKCSTGRVTMTAQEIQDEDRAERF
jgi:antitoxin (DNA-binding transcriptional repressor) of toxin-antitoxin stability system